MIRGYSRHIGTSRRQPAPTVPGERSGTRLERDAERSASGNRAQGEAVRKKPRRESRQKYEAIGERIPGQPRAYTGASGRKRSVIPGYDSERDVTRTSRAGENIIGAVGLCAAVGAGIGGTQGAGDAAGLGAVLGAVGGIPVYLVMSWLLRGGPMGS